MFMEPLSYLSPLFVAYYTILLLSFLIGLSTAVSAKWLQWLVLAQLFAALTADGLGTYLQYWRHSNNNIWVANSYILIEFMLYIVAAGTICFNTINNTARLLTGILLLGYSGLWVASIRNNGFKIFANWAYIIGGIAISLYFAFILFRAFVRGELGKISRSVKLFSIATIIYYCSMIPYFGFLVYLNNKQRHISERLYSINDILNIIRYFIIGLSFLIYRNERPKVSMKPTDGK
ncbi:MAG: hypothetical protein BGO69_04135 [Bacteroidetes bacterium 46-16]|nr:MAG: hypothetical protein BGO69_04135 [Bacteroidetes bacterium 46-16]